MVGFLFSLLMLLIDQSNSCSISYTGSITANFEKSLTVTGTNSEIVTLSKTTGPGSFLGVSNLGAIISSGTTVDILVYMTLPGSYTIASTCTMSGSGSSSIVVASATYQISLTNTVFFI